MDKKVGFIIQARMSSTRFPGKVLQSIPLKDGKPMLLWIVDQLKTSSIQGDIIVATSTSSADDKLEEFCTNNKIDCFRGDEDDVFSRFQSLAIKNQLDVVIRLTGDNPLIDTGIIDAAVHYHINESNDYTYTNNLPVGMNVEIVNGTVFRKIDGDSLTKADREHVTLYIKNSSNFKKQCFNTELSSVVQNYRLTIDYPSDFLMLSSILQFYQPGVRTGIGLINYIQEEHPWIFEVNLQNVQRKQYNSLKDELNAAVNHLEHAALNRAAKILKEYE